ncbi:MAG TPA: MDR family oxidoreductase [Stellaceae bacterium]|jgi:acrylyl-CoA reductase (NADPH)|nr:MDR family oxidoreductase [Stellaceae bacterium]
MAFKGLLLEESGGKVSSKITTLEESALPPGDVLVDVAYSTLNYKDGMVLNGLGRLVRTYPHVPGIDFAGTVAESSSPEYDKGDQVVLTGWGVGEQRWGGYAQKARVKASELVKLPQGLSPKQAMAIGTAGFTAMLAARALEEHGLKPEAGEVLVTGASGGVGSVAIAILVAWGYSVTASSGRVAANGDYLKSLGVKNVIDRAEIAQPKRPLDSERWAGCIDAVGGATLACVLSQLKYGMSAASCGLAGGNELSTTVIPFLLRGVNLLGIDSVRCPMTRRQDAWTRLATDLPAAKLEAMTETVPLADLPSLAGRILKGDVKGRVVVDVSLA